MCYSLPKSNGIFHLPSTTGKYSVGCLDIFSRPRNGKLPLLYRLYYPTEGQLEQSRWPAWLPNSKYTESMIAAKWPVPLCRTNLIDRLKHHLSKQTIYLLSWLLKYVSGDPKICAYEASHPIKQRLPLVVFSHGLIACRTSYSSLCTDLASQGYFVAALEHADSSACVRMLMDEPDGEVSWLPREELPKGAPEGDLRARQLDYREKEIIQTLESLEDIDKGQNTEQYFYHLETLQAAAGQLPSLHWFQGLIDTENVTMSGHSMGGATTVRCLANHDHRFVAGVALDSWMFPVRQEKCLQFPQKLLFVNFERFQGEQNLKTMKRYETEVDKAGNSNVITIRNARHYACTDILIAFQGTWIGKFLFGAQDPNFNSLAGVLTSSELLHTWIYKYLYKDDNYFNQTLEHRKQFLFRGIDLKSKRD